MKHIRLASNVPSLSQANKVMSPLLDDDHCRIVAVELNDGEQLTKHHAAEPISVLCLSGTGIFTAGADLEDSTDLMPGTLLNMRSQLCLRSGYWSLNIRQRKAVAPRAEDANRELQRLK